MPTIALLASVAILAWVCVDIGQRFVPALFSPAASKTTQAKTGARRPSLDYRLDEVVAAHLFGVGAKPEPQLQAAPETRLRLTLLGVMASTDEAQARAVIASDASRDQSYAIGEQIEGTDAKLYAIEKDRVIIERGRALEKLSLERTDLNSATSEIGPVSRPQFERAVIQQEEEANQQEEEANQQEEEATQPGAAPPRQPSARRLTPRTKASQASPRPF